MTYRVTTYEGLQANLSAASTTVMLCRANIARIELNDEERSDLIWRIERQRAELEAMVLELSHSKKRRRSHTASGSAKVIDFRAS